MISKRVASLYDKFRNTQATICLDRARLITEFYSHPSMENYIIHRAKAFRYVLENKKIFIDPDCQMVGRTTSRWQGVNMYPDMTAWLRRDLETLDTRKFDKLEFLPGEKEELRQMAETWKGYSFGDYTETLEEDDDITKTCLEVGIMTHGICNQSTMCHSPNYPELIKHGYRYYIDVCKKHIADLTYDDISDGLRRVNWEAMIIVMEGIINFAHRYADLADQQAAECQDPVRKQELLTIAENCRTVPEYAPKTFLQAVQLVWFTHMCLTMETAGGDHTLGRFDQYMYPFFEKEKAEGKPEEYFADIIHEFKIKIAEIWNVRTEHESEADPGNPLWMHIMLGGVLPDGTDGCNELTRVFLRCMRDLQTDEPCISFRYHPHVDEETFRLAIEVARDSGGHPAFYNDTAAITYLLQLGFTLKEARDWGICGCIEPHVLGKTDFQSNAGYINPTKILDIMLHNGVDTTSGKQLGPKTGDPRNFKSIKDVEDALETQFNFFLDKYVTLFNKTLGAHAVMMPTITGSLFSDGCMDKGLMLQQGGSDHHYSTVAVSGWANIIDSLAAIEECVFNKKAISMEQLVELLDSDFEGREDLRQMLINRAPKFGNDNEEVDQYGHWLMNMIDEALRKHHDAQGGPLTIVVATQAYNVEMGRFTGATPDGRHAGTPLADNVSPMIGMDTNGPTAVVKSLSCCDQEVPLSGLLLNQRFDPTIAAGEKGLDIIETVFRAHFNEGGYHIQINVLSDETLRAAQKHPEDYRNIIVRVAGYSAYFVDLNEEIQNNIIDRTIQRGV